MGSEGTAQLIRIMRGNLLDTIHMPYVMTARAKGLSERIVIYKHAVRNAIHPLIMHLGLTLPSIISGSTVVSIVLSLPIIGPMYFDALAGARHVPCHFDLDVPLDRADHRQSLSRPSLGLGRSAHPLRVRRRLR